MPVVGQHTAQLQRQDARVDGARGVGHREIHGVLKGGNLRAHLLGVPRLVCRAALGQGGRELLGDEPGITHDADICRPPTVDVGAHTVHMDHGHSRQCDARTHGQGVQCHAHRQHAIGLLDVTARHRRRRRAEDAQVVGVVAEQVFGFERVHQQGAGLLGQGLQGLPRACPMGAHPGDDERPLCLAQQADGRVDGRLAPGLRLGCYRQFHRRRPVAHAGVTHLHVGGQQEHRGLAQRGLGHRIRERLPGGVGTAGLEGWDATGAHHGGGRKGLEVRAQPIDHAPAKGRVAADDQHRHARLGGRNRAMHGIGHRRTAAHQRDAQLAGGGGVAHGHHHRVGFVARANHPHAHGVER